MALSPKATKQAGIGGCSIPTGQTIGSALGLVIDLAYVVYFWTTSGATPGKMAMGLRVVSTDGSPLTVGKAVIRFVGYIVSFAVLLIGFIWIAFDANKQGWHDKIAGTYVIKTR